MFEITEKHYSDQNIQKIVYLGPLSNTYTYKMLKNYLNSLIGVYELHKSKNKGKCKKCHAFIRPMSEHDYIKLLTLEHVIEGKIVQCMDLQIEKLDNNKEFMELGWSDNSNILQSNPINSIDRRVYFWNTEFKESDLKKNNFKFFFQVLVKLMKLTSKKKTKENFTVAKKQQKSTNNIEILYGFVTFSSEEVAEMLI